MGDMVMGHKPMSHIKEPSLSSHPTTQERIGSSILELTNDVWTGDLLVKMNRK
jgi:hypothetical protein